MTESHNVSRVTLFVGDINGKKYSLKVSGFGSGGLFLSLMEESGNMTSDFDVEMKEVGSIMEVFRVAGSEAHELILTPTED